MICFKRTKNRNLFLYIFLYNKFERDDVNSNTTNNNKFRFLWLD